MTLAGCGINGSGRPVIVTDAPRLGLHPETPDASPARPDDAHNNASDLVRLYLEAAAWANSGATDPRVVQAQQRVQDFLTDDAKKTWQAGAEIRVVQATVGAPVQAGATIRVPVLLRPVGRLTENGEVDVPTDTTAYSQDFMVVQTREGLRLTNPPPGMLLSTDGLQRLYEVHPIYFWDTSDTKLVPDLRYLPRSVEQAKRPNTIVRWLMPGGPSGWLRPIVQRVPAEFELADSVTTDGQKVVVNLSARAASQQDKLAHLVIQIRWSLRPLTLPVEVQVAGQRQMISGSSDYLSANPAVPPTGASEPYRYCVTGGVVHPAEVRGGPPIGLLNSPYDSRVDSAAVFRTQAVALVRNVQPGRYALWLGTADRNSLDATHYVDTGLSTPTMSRPVWLADPKPQVLVAAGGELYQALQGTDGAQIEPVPLPVSGPVTAVAVAPDYRRIAVVAGGTVYVGLIRVADTLSVVSLHAVESGLTERTGVAWSREDRIVVAGRGPTGTGLVEVSVDGVTVQSLDLTNVAQTSVSRVVGFPSDPSRGPDGGVPGLMMVEAVNPAFSTATQSYRVYSHDLTPLHPDNDDGRSCTAPFFVDY